jgi:hypothetical protein
VISRTGHDARSRRLQSARSIGPGLHERVDFMILVGFRQIARKTHQDHGMQIDMGAQVGAGAAQVLAGATETAGNPGEQSVRHTFG